MSDVPGERLLEPALERALRPPTELPADLRRIDGVATVVAGTILDELEQVLAAPGEPQDRPDDLEVLALRVAADVVDLTGPSGGQHREQRGTVIRHVDPVADVAAVA